MLRSIGILLSLVGASYSSCPHEQDGLALWSDSSTWPSNDNVPVEGDDVHITKPILLDGVTPPLNSVHIHDGGILVFDPSVDLAKLTTGSVLIENDGEMWIGSSDCKFQGNAEILLTGTQDEETEGHENFGQKFIGVAEGGTLEIHGKDKKSWSMLAKTLEAKRPIFDLPESDQPGNGGVFLYEFNRNDGSLIWQSGQLSKRKHVNNALSKLQESSVIAIVTRGWSKSSLFNNMDQMTDVGKLEPVFDMLRGSWSDGDASWAYVMDTDEEGTVTVYNDYTESVDGVATTTSQVSATINGILYRINNKVMTGWPRNPLLKMSTVEAEAYNKYDLEMVDSDLGSWEQGDKLVIASTDYDYQQAEEVVVDSVEGNIVHVIGELKYDHYADIYETIEMRAEVGLLTRNILIHGAMGEKCLDVDSAACQAVGFDNFGGHTKALRGFKAYNIEGAELTNMGQMSVLGSYPIHFHMCHNTTENGQEHPLIQSNSIHHCFSRCVTIHGSHGVHVKNNVAHDTYGHCYFLEDGGEKETVFEGNLGLTTRNGFLTPSDTQPSTFWLTSPLVTMTNNHAAGSDRKGVGIWYLFPNAPVGPSQGLFYENLEAKHTPITLFENNVAHSNGQLGLAVFRRLREDHGLLGCSTYNPRADPLNKDSELVPAIFEGFTGFKNYANAKMRITTSRMNNFKLSDAKVGIKFIRNMLDGYQLFTNAVIVAESPNLGVPRAVRAGKKENGAWHWVMPERSWPIGPDTDHSDIMGIAINNEGPLHLHNVAFKNFRNNEIRNHCGIKFDDWFRFGMGPSSSVKGLTWDFDESKNEASRVCHDNLIEGPDEQSMTFRDLDGSLTGKAGTSLVSSDSYLLGDLEGCEHRENWNMTVCEGDFARFYVMPKPETEGTTFITKAGDNSATNRRRKVSYTIRSDITVVFNHYESVPGKVTVRTVGIQKGAPQIIGFCVPKGDVASYDVNNFVTFEAKNWRGKNGNNGVNLADSLEQLKDDSAGMNAYLDRETRVLYIKFEETEERGENDLADCPGGNKVSHHCPWVTFSFKDLKDVDLTTSGTGICDA